MTVCFSNWFLKGSVCKKSEKTLFWSTSNWKTITLLWKKKRTITNIVTLKEKKLTFPFFLILQCLACTCFCASCLKCQSQIVAISSFDQLKPKEKKNLDSANQINYILLNVAGQRIVFTKLFVFGISVISKTRFWIQWILHEWAR